MADFPLLRILQHLPQLIFDIIICKRCSDRMFHTRSHSFFVLMQELRHKHNLFCHIRSAHRPVICINRNRKTMFQKIRKRILLIAVYRLCLQIARRTHFNSDSFVRADTLQFAAFLKRNSVSETLRSKRKRFLYILNTSTLSRVYGKRYSPFLGLREQVPEHTCRKCRLVPARSSAHTPFPRNSLAVLNISIFFSGK